MVKWLKYLAEVPKVAGSNSTQAKTGKLSVHPAVNGYLTIAG